MGIKLQSNEERKAKKFTFIVVLFIIIFFVSAILFSCKFLSNLLEKDSLSKDLESCLPSDSNRAEHNREASIEVLSWSPNGSLLAACSNLHGYSMGYNQLG